MMEIYAIVFLYCTISINFINAAYSAQKCYVCENNGCDHPGAGDIKSCSDGGSEPFDGKKFVDGALGGGNQADVYKTLETEFQTFAKGALDLNDSSMPSWESLTRWACYVSKDKRRGCFVMAKGLCSEDKTWLAQVLDVGNKLTSIMRRAKDAVSKMFKDANTASGSLDDNQKLNISTWMAEKYMAKLVDNKNGAENQLDTCCEGNECNPASMVQKSTAMLVLLFLSTLILV